MTAPTNSAAKIPVPTRYPRFIDIETLSPPVSPTVVAAILMSQKPRVTSGTLAVSGGVPWVLGGVVVTELSSIVESGARTDHAEHERGHGSHRRTDPPAHIATRGRADEAQQFGQG
jgi:hypothetical protein